MKYFDQLDEWEQHYAFATWFQANVFDEALTEAEEMAYGVSQAYSNYAPSEGFEVKGRCYTSIASDFDAWYEKLESDDMVQTYLYEGAMQGTGCDMSLVMDGLTNGWVGADLPLTAYQDCLYENVVAAVDGVPSRYLTSLCPFSNEAPVVGSDVEWQDAWRHAISDLDWDVLDGEPFPHFDQVISDVKRGSSANRDDMIDEAFSALSGYIPYVAKAVGDAFAWYGDYYIGFLWQPSWMFTCYDDFVRDTGKSACFDDDGRYVG